MLKLKENDLVYTPFGYGTILILDKKTNEFPEEKKEELAPSPSTEEKSNVPSPPPLEQIKESMDFSMATVKMKWGGVVSLMKKLLKKKITVNVKTFFANRKTLSFELDLNTTIQQVKNLIIEKSADQSKTLYNLRLIYPMGSITELAVATNTLEMYRIPDNSKLILIAQTTFFFDPSAKASGIKLSNNNLSAYKNGESDYQTVLGNLALSSGRNYWEIKIDKFVDEEDIFLGIARKNLNLYTQPSATNLFWGYLCLCAKRSGPDGAIIDYGYAAKLGDTIGVLLEFRSGVGSLSFYRNGTKCGVAFSNLTGTFYPAVSLFYGEVQVTLDPKAPMPLN